MPAQFFAKSVSRLPAHADGLAMIGRRVCRHQVGHDAEVVRGKGVLRLHIEYAAVQDVPAMIDKDFVQAAQTDSIELICRRPGGTLESSAVEFSPAASNSRRLGVAGPALKSPVTRTASAGSPSWTRERISRTAFRRARSVR